MKIVYNDSEKCIDSYAVDFDSIWPSNITGFGASDYIGAGHWLLN